MIRNISLLWNILCCSQWSAVCWWKGERVAGRCEYWLADCVSSQAPSHWDSGHGAGLLVRWAERQHLREVSYQLLQTIILHYKYHMINMIKQDRIFSQNKPSRQVGPHKLIPPTFYRPDDFQTKLSHYNSDRFIQQRLVVQGKSLQLKKSQGWYV